MRTITPRTHQSDERPEVFRTPRKVSDTVYEAYNSLVHRAKLTEGTVVYGSRLIREESFTLEELVLIKGIMTGDEETAELSSEVLGGSATIAWIDSILKGGN